MEEQKYLKQIAEKTGRKISELKEIWKEAKERAKNLGKEDNERIVRGIFGKLLRRKIRAEITGRVRREPVTFKGFILGCGPLRDTLEFLRRKAIRAYNEDPESAKLLGLVDEQGNPLDPRETIRDRFGREVENPNFHKPLIGHNYVRDVYGIVVKEGEKEPKLFKATLWRGFATKFTYKPFVTVTFKALINSEDPYYDLTFSRAKDAGIRPIEESIDVTSWIREALKDRYVELEKLEEKIDLTKDAIDREVLIEGTVDYIDTEINPKTGTRTVLVTDVDKGFLDTIRISIPKDFPLAFREYSRVLVFGIPRKWRRSEEDDYRIYMNGISIYPIPGETVEEEISYRADTTPTTEDEEEGWNLWREE